MSAVKYGRKEVLEREKTSQMTPVKQLLIQVKKPCCSCRHKGCAALLCVLCLAVLTVTLHLAGKRTRKVLSSWTTVSPTFTRPDVARQDRLFVTAPPIGRLGNTMFQYASLLGIAHMNNGSHRPVYSAGSYAALAFQLTQVSNQSYEGFRQIREVGSGTYDTRFVKLEAVNVSIDGFLQSWKYFHHIESVIRREFTSLPGIRTRGQQLLRKLSTGRGVNVTTVGVHIRRGDYVHPDWTGQFRLPPLSYFDKAADYFRNKYGQHVLFIIVSMDPDWCGPLLRKHSDFVIADAASPPEHHSLLTQCDHIIMSLGSFGWWAGYLAGGEVVYYNNCVYPNMTAKKGFIAGDSFLPTWIGVGD